MMQKRSRREFLKTCGPAAALAIGTSGALCETASAAAGASARKGVSSLRAKVLDGKVRLSVYKSTPAFQSKSGPDRFRTIRVYRREEPGFTFGQDYAEYFDGLSYHDAELICQGPLKAANKRKFTSMTYRGPAPASEPETRAVIEFLRANSVEAVYSFHCLASICGSSPHFSPAIYCEDGSPAVAASCGTIHPQRIHQYARG